MTRKKHSHLQPVDELEADKGITGPPDPNVFVYNSTDELGHGAHLRSISVPSRLAARVEQLVTDPKSPYRSNQDVVRDALWHRLGYLESVDPNPDPTTRKDLSFMRMDHILACQRAAVTSLNQAKEAIKELVLRRVKAGPSERAIIREAIDSLRAEVEAMEEPERSDLLRGFGDNLDIGRPE